MSKRYYQRDFEELYYIIDSEKISEKDFDEKVEYDGYYAFEDSLTGEEIVKLLNENEQLKQQKARYKRLSEIRSEEIDNRILTIKEFIDNCSNEEVKKTLEDLFYSEVNEYDLSKKYRKLHEENEDLKKEITQLTIEVEALKQIKPSRKLPREVNVLKLNDGDVE